MDTHLWDENRLCIMREQWEPQVGLPESLVLMLMMMMCV